MTSFPAFTLLFVQKYSRYTIKRKLHGGLKIRISFSRGKKTMFYSLAVLSRKIFF